MQIKVIENENEVYQKEKLLGQGAFGKAYLVKYKPTGQYMVIKEMNIEHMSSKEKQETIKQAQILKSLNHPNIINFKEVYVTKNHKLKIVMQYAECGDIAKAIAQRKAKKQYFDQTQILNWFTQICLAIKHVHDRKILHRDIKGHNIFISKNNSLKLGDFGIARVLSMTNDKARTVVGTPYYLSPQIIQNKPYSFKSDIWSIGAVLYQLCALQPPFIANSLQMLALKIVKGEYSPIPNHYSQQLKNLIKQILTLDPNKRPNTNEILKKPIVTDRIRNFLTQTKRIAEFSHTILHNQKVQIFANKLVQIQKQKNKSISNQKNQKNLSLERQKLKQQQHRMEIELAKKKQEKKKIDQIRKKQQQIKRKQQEKKKWLIIEQQKKQQMQRQYEENIRKADLNKQRRIEQEKQKKQYQRQIQQANFRKYQQQQQRRKKQVQIRKMNKIMEQDKKQQDFNEFARKQYFENLQIRKRAEQRARRQQLGYSDPPPRQQPPPTSNYPYLDQNRPKTKQQSRGNSAEKKKNSSDLPNRPQKPKQQPTQQQLINAFCNPNYNKKTYNTKWSKQIKQQKKTNVTQNSKQIASKKQIDSKTKIQQQREQMKRDRNNYNRIKQTDKQQIENKNIGDDKIGKWQKKKSQQKKEKQQNQNDSPRFNHSGQFKSPSRQTTDSSQEKSMINFNKMIEDSNNLFLQAKNVVEFDKYVEQLQDIVHGIQTKIDDKDQIQVNQEIKQRQDDLFELSLTTVQSKKQQHDIDREGTDLDYFSNYSKLETLRMQLEEALGLDNFIKLYRYIEKQVSQKGLDGFNITQAIRQIGTNIDAKIANKNGTLLLTLVTLQDKMSYT